MPVVPSRIFATAASTVPDAPAIVAISASVRSLVPPSWGCDRNIDVRKPRVASVPPRPTWRNAAKAREE